MIGSLSLEEALTSRDKINSDLRIVLDEATERWGIRVNRIELKSIDPPATIQEAMEKQMRAERDKRAAILQAEGAKQSAILRAEGEREAQVLTRRGREAGQDPARAGRGGGDAADLPGDPRRPADARAADLRVPEGAAQARRRRGDDADDDPVGRDAGDGRGLGARSRLPGRSGRNRSVPGRDSKELPAAAGEQPREREQ